MAGVINNVCTMPLDVVATNAQVREVKKIKDNSHSRNKSNGNTQKGWIAATKHVYETRGAFGFWSGLGPSCLLAVNPAINYAVYDRLKLLYNRGSRKSSLSVVEASNKPLRPLEAFFIGAASKAMATTLTFPLIRAKILLMTSGNHQEGKSNTQESVGTQVTRSSGTTFVSEPGMRSHDHRMQHSEKLKTRRSTIQVLIHAVEAEGVSGLYKGLGLQLSRSALAAAIMFMTREQLEVVFFGALQRFKQSLKHL